MYVLSTNGLYRTSVDGGVTPEIITYPVPHFRIAHVSADAHSTVFWSSGWDSSDYTIHRLRRDGHHDAIASTDGNGIITALALDEVGNVVYWARTTGVAHVGYSTFIHRTDLATLEDEVLIFLPNEHAASLEIDVDASKVYWGGNSISDTTETSWVSCANLDGTQRHDVVPRSGFVIRDIALDPKAGRIFWTQVGPIPRVHSARLDGTDVQTLFESVYNNGRGPYGIIVDRATSMLYWTDDSTSNIWRSNLDGSSRESISTAFYRPFKIAVSSGESVLIERIDWGNIKRQFK